MSVKDLNTFPNTTLGRISFTLDESFMRCKCGESLPALLVVVVSFEEEKLILMFFKKPTQFLLNII